MVSPAPWTGNGSKRPRLSGHTLLGGLLLALVPLPAACRQAPEADAYRDREARMLMERARMARYRDIEGMQSYEGVLRERIYVGLTALRFRRERSLFEQERIARLRWSAGGERAIQWLGVRRAIPIVGADTRPGQGPPDADGVGGAGAEVRAELQRELPDELLREVELPAFVFDPAGDRLMFGDDWALHPLSDSAAAHYRFASGDTLRLRIPSEDREIVLEEVLVEPRRADFHLVAGSLWFDAQSASLVRATYKPARPFDLALDEPEDSDEVPGFLKPVQAEITYITVEYSLQEFRYWLPRRFALEGEARLGGLVRIPLTVEWNVGEYSVNEEQTEIPLEGPLPPGWSRREERTEDDRGKVSYVTVIVPETEQLVSSPELSEEFGERTPTAFTDAEVDELRGELESMLPTFHRFRPRFAWGWERGLIRYNRVEGLSLGVVSTFPLAPSTDLDMEARVGTADVEPNLIATLSRGAPDRRWALTAYHRLESMSEFNDPFTLKSSVAALLLGLDRGQYFRTTGASLSYARTGQNVRWSVAGFHEAQRPAQMGTDFYLTAPIRDDSVATVLQAERLDQSGVRTTVSWFAGIDPNGLILTGSLSGELSGGDATVARTATAFSASHPLPFGLAGAAELGAGALWSEGPLQSEYFLGGATTLRGIDTNKLHGTSFWRARGELASGFAGARLAVFTDLGWAGPREDFTLGDPIVSVGAGASLLDGIFRLDLARAVRREGGWKLHLYLDGLF